MIMMMFLCGWNDLRASFCAFEIFFVVVVFQFAGCLAANSPAGKKNYYGLQTGGRRKREREREREINCLRRHHRESLSRDCVAVGAGMCEEKPLGN